MAEVNPAVEAEADALSDELVARLKALPYPAYLTCVASFLTDLRDFYADEVSGPDREIVDRTIEITAAAAGGQPVESDAARLQQRWVEYRGQDDEDDLDDLVEVDLPTDVHLPAYTAALELANPAWRYDAAEPIGDAAYRIAVFSTDPGDHTRLLREFTARARNSSGG